MDAIKTEEPKGDYVREMMGALRKSEVSVRQLQTENTQLAEQVRRLKRIMTSQADEIARLKIR